MKRTLPPTPTPDKESRRRPQSGQRPGAVGASTSAAAQTFQSEHTNQPPETPQPGPTTEAPQPQTAPPTQTPHPTRTTPPRKAPHPTRTTPPRKTPQPTETSQTHHASPSPSQKHTAEAAAFDTLNELTRQRHAHACRIIPNSGTGSWIRRNYDRIIHELRYGAPPMLVVAALDGALNNPKDVRFGNAPVSWLAQTTTMSTKEASDLRSACTLLYRPGSIVLSNVDALSVGKRTIVQRQLQQELRQRLIHDNIGTTALATIARASDNLSDGVKDQRLAIIYAALDSVTDRSASEFKRTIDTLVAEANRSPRANPKTKRQPKLTFQQPDGSGFALAYSYADATDQAQQRALTGDIATMMAQLATHRNLPNPLAGFNQAGRLWHAQHQSIKLTYSALRQGYVGFDAHGDLAIVRPARRSTRHSGQQPTPPTDGNTGAHAGANIATGFANGSSGIGGIGGTSDSSDSSDVSKTTGNTLSGTSNVRNTSYAPDDNDDNTIVPTPKASMVVYTTLEQYNQHFAGKPGKLQQAEEKAQKHQELASTSPYTRNNNQQHTRNNNQSPHSRSVPTPPRGNANNNPRTCFTNYGSSLTAAQARELSPHGADHVAIVGTDGCGSIHTLSPNTHSGDVSIQQSLSTHTDTRTRSATQLQRIFLGLIQPYCAHPGCTITAIECQAHHLHPYAQGGATTIENLALLCRFHHTKTDDSQRKPSQGHYAKDGRGVTYWQPHGDPLPQREYNEKNVAHYHQLNRAPDEQRSWRSDQHGAREPNRHGNGELSGTTQDHPPP